MRRNREIAFLVARLVTEVAAAIGAFVAAGGPVALSGLHIVVAAMLILLEADRVEDEELQLGTEIASRCDAACSQIGLGLACYIARIPGIGLIQHRIEYVADHCQRRGLALGVDEGGRRVRLEQHVRFVDFLKATDRRTVETDPIAEEAWINLGQGDREVLPEPRQIREPEVDDLDVVLLDHLDHGVRILRPVDLEGTRLYGHHGWPASTCFVHGHGGLLSVMLNCRHCAGRNKRKHQADLAL